MKKTILITILISAFKFQAQNTFPNIGSASLKKPQGSIVAYDIINSNNITVTRTEAASDSSGQMWLKDSNGNVRVYLKSNNAFPSSILGELVIGEFATSPKGKKLFVNGESQFTGNVGIGTTNTGLWELAVNGKIRAKEIKVETGWSDFVFYDNYKLPTLQEVENHIKEKGHLKDIPSAKEVKENGIFLGEMDSKLLQKIEELTLYTIQQQKEIIEQKEKVEKLEKENEVLKSLTSDLASLKADIEKLKGKK